MATTTTSTPLLAHRIQASPTVSGEAEGDGGGGPGDPPSILLPPREHF